MQELMKAIANGNGNSVGIMAILGIVMVVAISKGYHVYDRDGSKPIFAPTPDAEKQQEMIEDDVVD